MAMEDSLEAALRTDIQAAIGKDRLDLARRQGRELRLVEREQDPLPLLCAMAVRHQAVAAFMAINAGPISQRTPAANA